MSMPRWPPIVRLRKSTLAPLSPWRAPAEATSKFDISMAGTVRTMSATVSAPTARKSSAPSAVTETPTAALPLITEPVISTSSTGATAGAGAAA